MFNRVMVSPSGALPQPSRAGVGILANVAPAVFAAEADTTLTIVQVGGGLIHQGTTLTSDVVYTLPTAADLLAAMPTMDINDAFTFAVNNSQAAAYDVVIAVGTGITKVGTNNTLSVAPQGTRLFTLAKATATTMYLY